MADNLPPLPPGATAVSATPPPPPRGATPIAAIPAPPKGAVPFSGEKPEGGGIMSQVGDAYKSGVSGAWDKLKSDFVASQPDKTKFQKGGFWDQQKQQFDQMVSAGKLPLDAFNTALSVTGIPQAIGAANDAAGRGVAKVLPDIPANKNVPGIKVAKSFSDTLGTAEMLAMPEKGRLAKAGAANEPPGASPPPPPKGFTPDQPPPPKGAMPVEGPLTEAPALTHPRKFEDQLFQLESNRVADKLDVMKAVKNAPDVPPSTWEKLYHHEENPDGVPLTPEEKAIYDQHIAPLKAESDKLFKQLEGYGYDLSEEDQTAKGYTPRYVAGRTRSYPEVIARFKEGLESKFQGGAAARSMRQTVDMQKSRRFWTASSPSGEKYLVHVGKDGNVLAFDGSESPRPLGTFSRGQKIGEGSKVKVGGDTWRLGPEPTSKEIEHLTKTRYHKNVLANRLDNVAKLRSAVRNAKFIQAMKESPEWHNVAVRTTDTLEAPKTNGREWRVPKTPQFQGYYMEPTVADALDDFSGRTRDLDGLTNGLDKAGNVVKGSIFWNPIPHIRNVANHYFVEKGLVGTATSVPSTARSLLRAAKSVMTQDENYMRSLRAGASLPYARTITSDLHKALTTKLGEDVAANPKEWVKIAQIAGYADPVEMVKALYKISNKALWSFGDILSVARQMELAEKGVPFAKAIKMTEEHMPNYRVPGQVMGSRMMSQLLTTPIASMFGRYQYNRLASYMNMAKDMVSSETSIKDKAAAMDKLAMLGVMLAIYYPALDKAWQGITGNKNAKVTRPGAASVPQAAYDVATGTKGPAQGAQSVFSPGIVEAPIEAYHGRYLWSGQPIAYPENLTDGHPDQFARDIGSWIGSKISPVGQAQRITEGSQSAKQFLLSQIGVQTPSDEQVAAKQKYGNRDAKSAARRAVKKANQRGD